MVRRLMYLLGAALLALGLHSPAQAAGGTARIRVIHAAPNTGAVDVFVDGTRLLTNRVFKSISDYQRLSTGEHRLAIAPAGQAEAAATINMKVSLDADKAYTVAAVGLQNVQAQIYVDDLSALPPGKARVRVIHTSPDTPGADVEVVNGPTLIHNIAFPDASQYLQVDAGSYDLQVVALGDNTAFLKLPRTQVGAGMIYDVVAVGRLANIGVAVATVEPQTARRVPAAASGGAGTSGGSQARMPNTGAEDTGHLLLLLLGLALCGLGAGVVGHGRQRATPRR